MNVNDTLPNIIILDEPFPVGAGNWATGCCPNGTAARYTLSHMLPDALQGKLPSIEQLERELGLESDGDDAAEVGRARV